MNRCRVEAFEIDGPDGGRVGTSSEDLGVMTWDELEARVQREGGREVFMNWFHVQRGGRWYRYIGTDI